MPRGPKPKPPGEAKRPQAAKHQWQHATEGGWAHGDPPTLEGDYHPDTLAAWESWFRAWWASFYDVEDVAQLRVVADVHSRVMRRELDPTKLVPLLDKFGLTPKGRQDLRWAPPVGEAEVDVDVSDELERRRMERAKRVS